MDKRILKQAATKHPSAITQPYDILMELKGFDAIYALCETLGGATVYVPSTKGMFAECMAREAIAEFNGYNSELLAKKYGITKRHLQRILSEAK